jgi:hypothetical protein
MLLSGWRLGFIRIRILSDRGKMKTASILKRALLVGTTCAAISWVAVAQAGTLKSGGTLYGDSVSVNYLGNQINTSAGVFPKASFNGVSIPDFWCIDLTHTVPYPPWSINDYTEAVFQSGPLSFTATQVSNLRTLFFNDYNGSLFTDPDNAAAFQLAIWDVLFDSDGTLTTYPGNGGSTFGVVPGTIASSVVTLAQGWITTAENGPQHGFQLTQLTNSDGHQAFVYPGPPSVNVPEPTGLALLGAGLLALFVARRRQTTGI